MMRRVSIVLIALSLPLLMSIMASSIEGEEEHNDSLDQATPLGVDWISGTVHDINESSYDMDYYSGDLPANSFVVVTLKKLDTNPYNEIYADLYDRYKETARFMVWDDYYEDWEYKSYLGLNVPGSETRGVIKGGETDSVFYLVIYGNGNYSVKANCIPFPDPNDPTDSSPKDERMNGSSATGKITNIFFESINIYDVDLFSFECNESNIRFRFERTDSDKGTLRFYKASIYDHFDMDNTPTAVLLKGSSYEAVSLYESYENIENYNGSSSWRHSEGEQYRFYFWGEGTYNITVEWFPLYEEEEEEQYDDDDYDDDDVTTDEDVDYVPMVIILVIMLIALLLPVAVIIVVVLMMVLIIKKGKKEGVERRQAPLPPIEPPSPPPVPRSPPPRA